MAECSNHRYCTCDVYTSHSKTSRTKSGGSKCSSNKEPNPFTYDENATINSDSGSTICYGYTSTTSCKAHKTECAGDTTGYAYDCPGHRSYNLIRTLTISNCDPEKIIDNSQISAIQDKLKEEISERKAHLMYSTQTQIAYDETNVLENSLIVTSQPNNIKKTLENLRARINQLPDYKNAPINTYSDVNEKNNIQAQSLKKLLADFNSERVDCICYSDCISYGLWEYTTCTCNINCKCNY